MTREGAIYIHVHINSMVKYFWASRKCYFFCCNFLKILMVSDQNDLQYRTFRT